MSRFVPLSLTALTVALGLTLSAAPVDLSKPGAAVLVNTNGKTKINELGVWNIWPDYSGVKLPQLTFDGTPVDLEFSFSPADTDLGWLDGHLFSLNDAQGRELLRVDMVRRGRLRLHYAGKKALSRPQNWSCTVINWDNLAPRQLTVRIAGESAALLMNGQTVLKLDGARLPAGTYTACLGKKDNRGALGWYRSFEQKNAPSEFPAAQPLPGNPEWAKRVAALEAFFITPEMDQLPLDREKIDYYTARTATAYIALDGLWYRLNRDLKPGFEFFLTGLESLAREVKEGKKPNYTLNVGGIRQAPRHFLAPDDTDFYYGDCGWGLAAYAPELVRLGVNLVSEHIWPNAVMDGKGELQDVMLIRRTMPQMEEFEKYGLNFDLMIAPYTPQYLLNKRPEWDGLFFGLGMEGEAEKLKQHAQQWKGRQAGHGFLKASVIDPEYREMCRKFLEYLLPHLRDNKAIVAIDLANEVQLEDYSPLMQKRFRDYLRKKYDTVDGLNRAWSSTYQSFDDVLMVRPLVFDRSNPVRFWDWVLCNREAGTEHFQFLNDLCKQYAPTLPTHIKHLPHEFGTPWYEPGTDARNFYDYADGIDRKALAQMTEIIGTDSWADNAHDASGRLSSDVPSQSLYFSLLKSYAPTKWIFDSEWHILRCDPPATPPACLDMVMQQNAIHGLRAGTFWLVCPGNGQHLELSSTAPLMLQSGLTTAKIRSKRDYFNALANRPRRFGVLYSPKSRYLGGDIHTLRLQKYFEAGLFAGVDMRVVDERQLINGEVNAKDLDLLVVLDCPRPMEETPEALRKFAADGGKLLLYGKFAGMLDNAGQVPFLRKGRFTPSPVKLVEQIRKDAAEFGVLPPVEVVGADGKAIYGIEYHTARTPDGRNVLYIANMSKEPRKLTVKGAKRLTDTDGSRPLPSTTVELPNWGTFIGIWE